MRGLYSAVLWYMIARAGQKQLLPAHVDENKNTQFLFGQSLDSIYSTNNFFMYSSLPAQFHISEKIKTFCKNKFIMQFSNDYETIQIF